MIQPIRPNDATGIYRRQVSDAEAASGASRAGRTGEGARRGRRTDEVTISDEAQQLRRVLRAVDDSTDVRAERVDGLRRAIADGTYVLDATTIAERLLDEGAIA